MTKQKPVDSLKESIRLLEIRQAEERIILNEQFRLTYESFRPVNLIKSSIKELTGSVDIKNNVFETVVSILSGYLTSKIMVNKKSNPLVRILGVMMQYGVTSLVAKNAETIRNYLNSLIDRFLHPVEEVPEAEE